MFTPALSEGWDPTSAKCDAGLKKALKFHLARVAGKEDNAIQRINHYLVDCVVCLFDSHLLDGNLSGRWLYSAFQQLGGW